MKTDGEQVKKLGTFSGVFTPSVLTILGIILFRRHGFVVGSSGLGTALGIICIANLISVLTSFSLAAIATNMKVKGGGDYYLISRTLGKEFGGAIGLVLFLAQSVSIGFYCIGFGEAAEGILHPMGWMLSSRIIAFAALGFLFVLAWVGADLATKFQYIVMALLVLALTSFYVGGLQHWDSSLLAGNWTKDHPSMGFWALFAIFFPAVTGFTQGVSMSGDLEDSGKSLPLGTFSAVAISILVYASTAVVLAASNSLDSLVSDYNTMNKTAVLGFLIDAGVIAATLSSAMASFLGAPRILQSLSGDKIFKILNPFSKGAGPGNNPRRGVLFSLFLAVAVISLGQLDLIAGIVSMFFLISYGLLNYATYFEASTLSPSFRPRFKWYHRYFSMAGFLACLFVMMAIDMKTGIASSAVLFAVYQYLRRVHGPVRWADSRRSHYLQQVRSGLLNASEDVEHPREWRPYVLIFSNDTDTLSGLLRFSSLIEGGSGITTAVRLVRGKGYRAMKLKQIAQDQMTREIQEGEFRAFPLVVAGMDLDSAANTLFQSYGLGPVKANTVLFSWQDFNKIPDKVLPDLKKYLKPAVRARCNTLILNAKPLVPAPEKPGEEKIRRIDVWWNGDDTGRLMLLLAYLATRSRKADSASIHLMAINYDRDNQEIREELQEILEDFRIEAEPSIILGLDRETLLANSKEADLVFLPYTLEKDLPMIFSKYEPETVLPDLATTAMVMAAIPMDLDAAPEEGRIGELAAVYDELEHAVARASAAEKEAVRAAEEAQTRLEAMEKEQESGGEREEKLIEAIKQRARQARQKAQKEKAKLEKASQKALEKGIEKDIRDKLVIEPSGKKDDL
ncbi:amino acid permease [Desulfospira joergensenii]|uniref:amino acid permease n=1 Tax=Desulfospira joergensenii TaxID=53329 RepID=UPI0003B598FC|nr:amino acid permease [Desulfospira joergensenii]